MDLKRLVETLHPLERRIVPALSMHSDVSEIIEVTKMQEIEVLRALHWLQNKGVLNLSTDPKELVVLGSNGKKYSTEGLPEKRFLVVLTSGKELTLNDVATAAHLDTAEAGIAIGTLKQKNAIEVIGGNRFKITELGRKAALERWIEEKFLSRLSREHIELKKLTDEEKVAFENLKRRKDIISIDERKTRTIELTEIGKQLVKQKLSNIQVIDRLTSDLVKSDEWKTKQFRRYDVKAEVPAIFGGRKQHYRRFLEEVRRKFMALGFKEMTGPLVETEFWNMDALFMPQFHSARDIHEGYYIKDPKYAMDLPENIVKRVKASHEKSWKYEFDTKRTHRHILRTHDTSISARTLASKDLQIPGKYFQMERCFRYDLIDATHLPDFNQVGGFVIEEGLTLRHLFGLLKMLAKEFTGAEEVKIVPGYFPFTEPSCELYAKHPKLGWIELGGAGIFRPELVVPLVGKWVPVIAWGLGIDRIGMFKLGINDIRQLFSHDLEFLRGAKVV